MGTVNSYIKTAYGYIKCLDFPENIDYVKIRKG